MYLIFGQGRSPCQRQWTQQRRRSEQRSSPKRAAGLIAERESYSRGSFPRGSEAWYCCGKAKAREEEAGNDGELRPYIRETSAGTDSGQTDKDALAEGKRPKDKKPPSTGVVVVRAIRRARRRTGNSPRHADTSRGQR